MDDLNLDNDDKQNVIIEINKSVEDTLYDEDQIVSEENTLIVKKDKKKKNKVNKNKKKFSWKNLTKKEKIIYISVISVILLIIIFVIIYFKFIKKPNKINTPVKEEIIIEKDNYIYNNGVLEFLDKDDKILGKYECENKDEKKCFVAYYSNDNLSDLPKYVDQNGKQINRLSQIYNNNFVFVQDGNYISLYDIAKKEKKGTYETINKGETSNNLVVFKDDKGKYGLLEILENNYNILIDAKFDYLEIYNSSDKFIASDDEGNFLVDKNGLVLTSYFKGNIKSFNGRFIVTYDTDYYIYDYNANKVLPDSYDNIKLDEEFVFTINNRKMIIYDNKLNKLNESAIKLQDNNFDINYIFDDKNILKETEKPFEYELKGSSLIIDVDGKETKINVYEGVINTKYDYINYYDGVLYIYSDIDKTSVIGSYKCKNKNTITSKNDEYYNCMIAKENNILSNNENIGYIPIINGNYVYIKDSKDDQKNIVLYDLTSLKILSEYNEVETGISAEKITHVTSINSLIFAKNTSGGYGAITFSTNGPVGVIAFNDTKGSDNYEPSGKTLSISYLKDYIYVKREKRNFLYDKIGNEIATSIFEIVDYLGNYMTIKDNNKYLVYSLKGQIISNEGKYISLKDNYFVLVTNDNKLNIYSYIDGKKKLLNTDLLISSENIENSFEINETDNNYIITIINKNEKKNYLFDKSTGKLLTEDNGEE
ncbi:MAG: hypothetical protein PUD07_00670 [bacterium]|nr:hypothetical protein [bacterium]